MTLRVAIQMDPLASINLKGDSTLRLGLEAQRRGHALFYYTPDTLSLHGDGKVTALAAPVQLRLDPNDYYTLGEAALLDLREMHVVLMRQDPPFDMRYMTASYILEKLQPKTLVVNDPASVRNCPEKLFPLEFAPYMPPTLISTHADAIRNFWREQGEIVIKPLYGYGGHSVFRIARDEANLEALLELLLKGHGEPLVVQRYLPEVVTREGDRRILLIDGEVAGVFGRLPAAGEIRANMRVGGTIALAELTPKQREICDTVGPVLKRRGLLFVGLDVIGDWLTEINITSPTGLAAIVALGGEPVEGKLWDAIERRVS